jgi:hypothetical protein
MCMRSQKLNLILWQIFKNVFHLLANTPNTLFYNSSCPENNIDNFHYSFLDLRYDKYVTWRDWRCNTVESNKSILFLHKTCQHLPAVVSTLFLIRKKSASPLTAASRRLLWGCSSKSLHVPNRPRHAEMRDAYYIVTSWVTGSEWRNVWLADWQRVNKLLCQWGS